MASTLRVAKRAQKSLARLSERDRARVLAALEDLARGDNGSGRSFEDVTVADEVLNLASRIGNGHVVHLN